LANTSLGGAIILEGAGITVVTESPRFFFRLLTSIFNADILLAERCFGQPAFLIHLAAIGKNHRISTRIGTAGACQNVRFVLRTGIGTVRQCEPTKDGKYSNANPLSTSGSR
jgi:hypothetical protein